jgi:hypothetical protein
MLTLRSTHLMVISYSDPGERIARFLEGIMPEQYSVLLGPHFGDLGTLVDSYLPQAGPEQLLLREAARRQAHGTPHEAADDKGGGEGPAAA